MEMPRRYRKKPDLAVVAVPLDLETEGFIYRKWGDLQHCKRGDWIVNNRGEIYTVDREVFDRTYRRLQPGLYLKTTPVWAEVASQAGSVTTKEGRSHYRAGDYLVYNDEHFSDAYCMTAAEFEAMYDLDE